MLYFIIYAAACLAQDAIQAEEVSVVETGARRNLAGGYQFSSVFVKLNDGEACVSGRIMDESMCIQAAESLGYTNASSFEDSSDVPGCIHANDGRDLIYFNSAFDANGQNAQYAEICRLQHMLLKADAYCEANYYSLLLKEDAHDSEECATLASQAGHSAFLVGPNSNSGGVYCYGYDMEGSACSDGVDWDLDSDWWVFLASWDTYIFGGNF